MARLRYNGLSTTLGAPLTSGATTVTFAGALTHSGGVAVPTITGADHLMLSILDGTGRLSEIVKLTAFTSGASTGTITRAQEGTAAAAHASGARVTHSPTAVDLNIEVDTPFRGEWVTSPLVVGHTIDFADGAVGPFTLVASTSAASYGVKNYTTTHGGAIPSPPAKLLDVSASNHYSNYNGAALDLDNVPEVAAPAKVRFWWSRASGLGAFDVRVNGTVIESLPANTLHPWQQSEVDVSPGAALEWRNTSGSGEPIAWTAYLARVEILEIDTAFAPYMTGEHVLHEGKMWVSDIDNNTIEPGGAGWTEIPLATGAGLFRGTWEADSLVHVVDLSSGVPTELTISNSATKPTYVQTTRQAIADAGRTGAPAASHAIRHRSSNNYTQGLGKLDLNIAGLGLSGVTRVKYWLATSGSDGGGQVQQFRAERNESTVLSSNIMGSSYSTWTQLEVTADSDDIVSWEMSGLVGHESDGYAVSSYVAGIEVYAASDPYMLGEYVVHNSKLWRSNSNNNTGTPGTSGWTEVPLGSSGFVETFIFTIAGPVAAQVGQMRLYMDYACTIEGVRASLGVPSAGASVIVDVNRNGTTLFTTQANRPEVLAGAYTDTSVPDVTALVTGDYLTLDVDQVGSTTAGSHLVVQIRVRST